MVTYSKVSGSISSVAKHPALSWQSLSSKHCFGVSVVVVDVVVVVVVIVLVDNVVVVGDEGELLGLPEGDVDGDEGLALGELQAIIK